VFYRFEPETLAQEWGFEKLNKFLLTLDDNKRLPALLHYGIENLNKLILKRERAGVLSAMQKLLQSLSDIKDKSNFLLSLSEESLS
ncbi:hypothetical protein ABTK14_22455, partial [Acinetobacter baumannii]